MTDESFRSWVNQPTPELDELWSKWIEQNEHKKDLLFQARNVIQSLSFDEFQVDSVSKQRIRDRIRRQSKPESRVLPYINVVYRIAAVLVIVFGLGALIYLNISEQKDYSETIPSPDFVQKSNTIGVKSQHMLSDGSKVFLNSGSSIEYPKTFDSDTRVVKLTGEAFFQVAHDASRPFRVVTDGFEVVVLGTQFNVNANLSSPTVALVDGKVRLNSKVNNVTLELTPGQMATFDKENRSFSTSSFDAQYVIGWKEGYLVFQEASLEEVLDKLHQWYGIDISVSNKSKSSDWSYSASFKNESLESVLINMSTLRRFEYQIKNDSLIISF